jgi:hypothetical protein
MTIQRRRRVCQIGLPERHLWTAVRQRSTQSLPRAHFDCFHLDNPETPAISPNAARCFFSRLPNRLLLLSVDASRRGSAPGSSSCPSIPSLFLQITYQLLDRFYIQGKFEYPRCKSTSSRSKSCSPQANCPLC